MSGQPYRYANDPEKFRDEYMTNLNLQADIDRMNLDANRTYLTTGQLPPVSQIKDNRTAAEVLEDNLKLRADISKTFQTIGDGMFINQVIDGIIASPYNINGSLFQFVAQRAPEIVRNLEKLYKYKIKGDADDVRNLVSIMEKMYGDAKQLTSVKNFFNRPAETGIINLTSRDLEQIKTVLTEVQKKLLLKKFKTQRQFPVPSTPAIVQQKINRINRLISDFKYYFDDNYDKLFAEMFVSANYPQMRELIGVPGLIDEYSKYYTRYHELIEEFPKADLLNLITRKLNSSLANEDITLTLEILDELEGLLNVGSYIKQFTEDLKVFYSQLDAQAQASLNAVAGVAGAAAVAIGQAPAPAPAPAPLPVGAAVPLPVPGMPLQPAGQGIKRNPLLAETARVKGKGVLVETQTPHKRGVYRESVERNFDPNMGITPSPRFVKFGKYLINNHKLNNESVLAIKRPSGAGIAEFPSQRISSNLCCVIKKMVGGGVPSFDELNKLSDAEKVYLQKMAQKANFIDKFSIPTPDKNKAEQDIHKFEVMKGQILSGNDSKELIKEFKLHILKMSRAGTLPKKEVSEIMEELIELGY